MNSNLKKITFIFILVLTYNFKLIAQNLVNKVWSVQSGNPLGLQWSSSQINADNQIITLGNNMVANQGADIFLSVFNEDGTLAWQRTYNSSGANNDYGITLFVDVSKNIYVCGTTDNSTTGNNDVILLKYSSNGNLIWATTYNSIANKDDIGTAIKVDSNGNIFVALRSQAHIYNYDFVTLKLNPNGVVQWESRFDNNGYIDTPIGIEFDSNDNIVIVGASGTSFDNWDYVAVKYNATGNQTSLVRNSVTGTGYDLPTSIKRDNAGNIYVTGSGSSDGINYDIKTTKISPDLSILWNQTYDGFGKKDVGYDVDIDFDGNVVVGGFVTDNNNVKKLRLIKYGATGNQLWDYENDLSNLTNDLQAVAITTGNEGQIYVIAQEKNVSDDIVVFRIDKNGELNWRKNIATPSNQRPIDINIDSDGNIFASAINMDVANTYEIIQLEEMEANNNIVVDTLGHPLYKDNELIVRFKQSAINKAAIDNQEVEFADLGFYLTPQAKYQIDTALSIFCGGYTCDLKATKVFRELKTTDTVSISRLGQSVRIGSFWTTLLVRFPSNVSIQAAHKKLHTLSNIIRYSEPNKIITLALSCNDTDYDKQKSLKNANSNVAINVEEAWDVVPSGGVNSVKCGVFDTGVDYFHEDFTTSGATGNKSKIVDGWSYGSSISPMQNIFTMGHQADEYEHGTQVAGIIGAIRNNNLGIAGIAGGNSNGGGSLADKGVALYSMRFFDALGNFYIGTTHQAVDAILMTAKDDPSKSYSYGLHIQNHSWRYDDDLVQGQMFTFANNSLLIDAVHQVNRLNVTFCAARGNEGVDNLAYPAIIDDDWVLCVGGTGKNGCFITESNGFPNPKHNKNGEFTASYGHNVDIGAPAAWEMIYSTIYTNSKIPKLYENFNGTSAAAPHVSGVVALMMSYHNSPSPNYNNLAPEDCEHIIELSATDDTCEPGFDDYIGAGLLNAGRALKMIEKTSNNLYHFGSKLTSYKTKGLDASNISIKLTEDYENAQGVVFSANTLYNVNKYKVKTSLSHNIPANETIVSSWARSSSSSIFEENSNGELRPRERAYIHFINKNLCEMEGFIYEVFDANTNNFIGWLPFDANNFQTEANFEYSVLTSKTTKAEEIVLNDATIAIFPNPANDIQQIRVLSKENQELSISLLDIQGRRIKEVYKGTVTEIETLVENNIEILPKGVYIYVIKLANNISYSKFIKQ